MSRRKFERASIYTVDEGELLARVLRTPHGLVVVNDLFINHTMREVGDIFLPATSWIEPQTSNR